MLDQVKGQQFRMLILWLVCFIFFIICTIWLFDWQDAGAISGITTTGWIIYVAFPLYYSYLKKAPWSGITMSFFFAVWTIQFIPIWYYLWDGIFDHWDQFRLDDAYTRVVQFGALAALIAFGGMVGKVNGLQLMWVGLIFGFLWQLNYSLNETVYWANQQSMLNEVWIFGSTFGVVTAWILGPHGAQGISNENFASGRKTNIFAWIGMGILLIYLPTYNSSNPSVFTAANAPNYQGKAETITWICIFVGSVVVFIMSACLHAGKFKMEEILRSIFSCGIAMSGTHNGMIPPWAAILIMLPAAFLAPVYHRLLAKGCRKFLRLQDSTHIFFTFWVPAIYASVWSWFLPMVLADNVQGYSYDAYWPRNAKIAPDTRAKWRNGAVQLAGTITSLFLGVLGGLLAGAIKIPYAWAALEEPFDDDHLFAIGENSDEDGKF